MERGPHLVAGVCVGHGQLHKRLHLEVHSLVQVARHPYVGLLEQAGHPFDTGQDLQHGPQICCLVVIPSVHTTTHVNTNTHIAEGGAGQVGEGAGGEGRGAHRLMHACTSTHLGAAIWPNRQSVGQTDRPTDRHAQSVLKMTSTP